MYTIVLAAVLSTGNELPDFGRRGGGCRGCYGGGWGGCYGGCRGGCYGGGWGGCYGGCYGACYGGCWGGCYGGCWGGCGGGCWGCGGGMVVYRSVGGCGGMMAGGCTGRAGGGGGSGGGAGASSGGGGSGLGSGGYGGQGGASAELVQEIQDLKKSIEQLKKNQSQIRIEILQQVAEELKTKATEQKIDELRRTILELQRRLPPATKPVPVPVPRPKPELPPPQPDKGAVRLEMPADALVFVNEKCLGTASTFSTPVLKPGQEYVLNIEAVANRDGESVSRVKRLPIRAGQVIHLAYKDMQPAGTRWIPTDPKVAPAHITVHLPADARLTIQGIDCPLTSETRTIDTPELVPGKEYAYVLKAEVQRNGRTVAQSQNVTFRSGESVVVSFEDLGVRTLVKR